MYNKCDFDQVWFDIKAADVDLDKAPGIGE